MRSNFESFESYLFLYVLSIKLENYFYYINECPAVRQREILVLHFLAYKGSFTIQHDISLQFEILMKYFLMF